MQKVIALVFVICFLCQSIFFLASYFDCFEREKLYSAGLDAYLKEDYHSAVNLYTKALRENRFTGKKDELYAKTECCLGETYYAVRLYNKAEPLIRDAMLIQLGLKGNLDHNTVWYRSSLVNCLDAQHRYAAADLLLEEEVSIRRTLDPKGPGTAFRLCAMGGRYLTHRRFAKAAKLFEEALAFGCVREKRELSKSIQDHLSYCRSASQM